MEGIKWQQRDSYSAIICPVEYKLFFNNQEDWSKQDSTVITKAWCCFKHIHIHTGHIASNHRHIHYLWLVSLAQDFQFFPLPHGHPTTNGFIFLTITFVLPIYLHLLHKYSALVHESQCFYSHLINVFSTFNDLSLSGWSVYAVLAPSSVAVQVCWILSLRRHSSSWLVAMIPSLECGTFV